MFRKWLLLLTTVLFCSLSASSTGNRECGLYHNDSHHPTEDVISTDEANQEKESSYNYFQIHSSSSCLALVNMQSQPSVIIFGNNSHFNYFSQLRQSLLSLKYFSSALSPEISNANYKYLFTLSLKYGSGFYIYAFGKMRC